MKAYPPASEITRLEDLPNIGRSIAADLRGLGIHSPAELARRVPLEVYLALGADMGTRHDPCVLHTLLAVDHFLKTSEARPWWEFSREGKRLLRER